MTSLRKCVPLTVTVAVTTATYSAPPTSRPMTHPRVHIVHMYMPNTLQLDISDYKHASDVPGT